MDKLRLRFEKTGRAVYISHLDLMHTLQRAFSRAGLRLKYSEGFNPHPQISIALPLSVGVASVCEILDFRLLTEADPAELPARLSAVMPEGIRVTDCYEPVCKVAQLKYLEIEGAFDFDARPAERHPPRGPQHRVLRRGGSGPAQGRHFRTGAHAEPGASGRRAPSARAGIRAGLRQIQKS